jgi:fructose-1,6-bisphosphatase I/sedoheptulose-1,7-bisphosphatase
MLADRATLAQFLTEEQRRHPGGELNSLVLDIAHECAAIADRMAYGELGAGDSAGVHGERELEVRGKYLLVFEPFNGSSDSCSPGSIFSVFRAPAAGMPGEHLPPGSEQICAGYAIYGRSTMLVLTVGTGVFGFTLDPHLGEFVLTRSTIRIPHSTSEFAVNTSNRRFWEPAVKRYIDECLAGRTGARAKDFTLHWTGSLVESAHRILTRGGVSLFPKDTTQPAIVVLPRLLYEANPVAMLIEQAGGQASTGRHRILDIVPEGSRQRTGLVFGSSEEVRRIEGYHGEFQLSASDIPFYGSRGLFRVSS